MATVGSLLIKILGDADGLRSELEKAANSTKAFERSLENGAKKGLAALAGVGAAMVYMTVVAGQQAEAIEHLSQITGINSDALQAYDVVLARAGLEGNDLTLIMRTLSKSMEDARRGVGTAGDRFKQLGINIRSISGTDDLIRKIADSVSKFASGTEKAVIVNDLMGKGALRLIPAMEGGRKVFDNMTKASQQLGESLKQVQLGSLTRMDDAIDDLQTSWKRFGQQMGVFLAPSIELVAKELTHLLALGSNMFKQLDEGADNLAIKFTHVGLAMEEIARFFMSGDVFNAAGWKQHLANLELIDDQAAKLIRKNHMLREMSAANDARPNPPAMIDSAKALASAQAVADAQFKAQESMFKQTDALNKAELQNRLAALDAAGAAGIRNAEEVALARKGAIEGEQQALLGSLVVQLSALEQFNVMRRGMFANDEKGIQDRAKFEVESKQKVREAVNQLAVAMANADTAQIQSGAAVLAATKTQKLQPLQDAVNLARADFELQRSFYANAPGMIGATNAVREKAFVLLKAETELRQVEIRNQIADESRRAQAFIALDEEVHAKRMETIRQFPTFFEKQMQDVVQSNSFSVSQIISTWTGGVANAMVTGADFIKQAVQSTEVALLQFILNTGVQILAEYALRAAAEVGFATTTAATVGEINAAKWSMIIAGETTTAGATVGIWAGATTALLGMFIGLKIALGGLYASIIAGLTAVGEAIMAVLTAIGEAIGLTGFGAPLAAGILAGVVLIGVALAAAGALKFAKGGVVTGPTLGMIGEAGPEAVIPLDRLGDMGGGGRAVVIHTHTSLNGREIAMGTARYTPAAWRATGAPA